MTEVDTTYELLDAVSKVLIRCFFMAMLLVLYWLIMLVLFGDFVFTINSSFFPLSQQQFSAINYSGIALTKISAFVFFLFPYIAIRIVLCSKAA